eukprot:ctg_221.g85
MRETSGSTHLLEALAFRTATLERSAWRLARGIEDTGGSVACTAGRESIAYTGECMRDQAPALFRLVGEAALQPQFLGYGEGVVADDDDIRAQVRETLHLLEREIREVHDKDAQTQVTEALHAAAYEGNTLGISGLPLLMNEQRIKTITPEAVKAFWESRLSRPADVVVSAVGIGHDELVSLVEQQTGHLPLRHELAADTAIEPARYTGGESRLTGDGLAQLAFGAEGVSWSDPDLVPIHVLASVHQHPQSPPVGALVLRVQPLLHRLGPVRYPRHRRRRPSARPGRGGLRGVLQDRSRVQGGAGARQEPDQGVAADESGAPRRGMRGSRTPSAHLGRVHRTNSFIHGGGGRHREGYRAGGLAGGRLQTRRGVVRRDVPHPVVRSVD